MTHTTYVLLCYLSAAVTIAALIVWVVIDGINRRQELKTLEAAGIRRASRQQDLT